MRDLGAQGVVAPVVAALPAQTGAGAILRLSTDGELYEDRGGAWRRVRSGDMLKSAYDANNDGRIDAAALGTGAASVTTYLRGDNSWQAIQPNALDARLDSVIPKGSLTQLLSAIASGAVTDVWVGESVTEDGNLQRPTDNYRDLVVAEIRQTLPNVTWTTNNYALGARNIGQFADANFKGLAAEPTDLTTGFGPRSAGDRSWVVVGKSWMQHARDAAPDVLFLPFGMNLDYTTNASFDKFYTALDSVISQVRAWPKVPTIILITTAITQLSNTSGQPLWRATARRFRQAAATYQLALIDPHRRWSIARDLIDPSVRVSTRVADWDTWTYNAAQWTRSGTTMTPTDSNQGLLTFPAIEDAELTFNAAFTLRTNENLRIYLRQSPQGSLFVQMNAGGGSLFRADYQGTVTNLGSLTTVPGGALAVTRTLKFYLDRQNLIMTVDGTTSLNVNFTLLGVEGNLAVGNDQANYYSPVLSNVTVVRRDGSPIAGNAMPELKLLGDTSGYDGNGQNHPTSFAYRMVMAPAFRGFYEAMTQPLPLLVKTVTASFTAAVGAERTMYAVNASSGAVTATLPSATASPSLNRVITMKQTDSSLNTVTVATTGGQTVDGQSTFTLGHGTYSFVSDGSNWMVL